MLDADRTKLVDPVDTIVESIFPFDALQTLSAARYSFRLAFPTARPREVEARAASVSVMERKPAKRKREDTGADERTRGAANAEVSRQLQARARRGSAPGLRAQS